MENSEFSLSGGNDTIGLDSIGTGDGVITITNGTTTSWVQLEPQPQYVDQEILEYNVSENRKNIEIIVKQKQAWGQTYIGTTPNFSVDERILKRIYKVRNGKLKLFKEEVGEVIPPQHIPESYRFNEEKK
jgi:hypothetical protein